MRKKNPQAQWITIGIIGIFFFIFGFITWLNGILIPYLKISCELNYFESSFLIMGNLGGALLPLLYGRMADIFNPQQSYIIVIPCYLFILYYAALGHKLGKRAKEIPAPALA